MREEGWNGELWDRFVEIYFVFVSSKFVAIFMDVFVNNSF